MQLGPLLDALVPARVERPPLLWEADAGHAAVDHMLAQMVAAVRAGGNEHRDVVVRANNVTVEAAEDVDEGASYAPAPGDYVALTVLGAGDWCSDTTWRPTEGNRPTLGGAELDAAARAAGAAFAYTRYDGDLSSITVFLPRLGL